MVPAIPRVPVLCVSFSPRPVVLPVLLHRTPGYDATKYACREPWHDIHAKVEGPAAMDICLNCESACRACLV